jgi:hypothetical protein
MEQHMKILGILNIVYASFGILVALVIFAIFGGSAGLVAANNDPDAAVAIPILGAIGLLIIFCVAIFTAPAIIAGIGLLKLKAWSRPWTIVASILHLLSIPFGTALGIYGLWVMFKDETAALIKAKNPA